jgi:hypothetical protein
MLTTVVPSTLPSQITQSLPFEPPQSNKFRQNPDSGVATVGSQPAVNPNALRNQSAVPSTSVYSSPYKSPYETLASPAIPTQSAIHNSKQSPRTPARRFDDDYQKQNAGSHAQIPSVPSGPVWSGPTTSPVPVPSLEKPAATVIPTQPTVPRDRSLLARLLAHPAPSYLSPYASPYASPYTLPYKSPYTPQAGPQESQQPATSSQLVPPMHSLPPPAQISAHGPPRGFFTQQPADPQLLKELTAKPIPDSRTSASTAPRRAREEARKRRLSEANAQADESQAQAAPQKLRPQPRQQPSFLEPLSQAEAVAVPEGVTRLACIFRGLRGNLLLSKDLSVLEFFSTVQHPPESPMFFLPISRVTQNPITSMPGSKPMEIRIKAKDDGEKDITNCFSFSETDEDTEAANTMRAKIVTALIAYQFRTGGNYERPGEVQQEILKPYKCEKCGGRFKNKGGLDYHLTKSATTCNPNCDLSLLAEKRERAEKRKKQPRLPKQQKEPNVPSTQKKPQVKDAPDPKATIPLEIQEAEQSDSTTSSEDSIIEFWKQNSTTGVERPRKVGFGGVAPKATPSKSKVYKSLPYEASVLREIAKDIAASTEELASEDPISTEGTMPLAEPSTSEKLDGQRCEEILLSLVHNNNNIFPGDRSIWIAFVGVWMKQHARSLILPESKLCRKAVDDLVEKKKLKSIEFTFIDSKKRLITRTILTVPGNKFSSAAINVVKESIQTSHPMFYVPSRFAPPEPVLSKLNALATRTLPDRFRVQDSADIQSELTDSRSQSPAAVDDESSDDEFIGDGNEEDEPLADLGSEEEESGSENEANDEADENKVRRVRGTRKRTAHHNKKISEGVRRSWAKIKATQNSGYFPHRKSRKDRVPLTQEEKDRRARMAALRQRSWDAAPAFMPNPQTGAWDQLPPKPSKKGHRHEMRPRLPEPITYMQATNGAWSVRPFGHGVNPIYSRPSRRAQGNPGFESYRKKLENGFRPVIYPKKNRMLGPAIPSKALLRKMSEPDYPHQRPRRNHKFEPAISKRTGKPIRRYQKRTGSSQAPDSEDIRISGLFPRLATIDENYIRQRTSTGRNTQGTNVLDEVLLLNFFEPKKLEPDAPRNIGLDTIPPNFGLGALRFQGSESEAHDYQPNFDNLQFIEPKIVEEGLDPGEGSWTVGAWTPSRSEGFNVRWDDATAFDLETVPYESLDFDPETSERESIEPPSKRRKRQFVPNRQTIQKLSAEEKYSFVRVLTSLPHDFDGVLENPQDAPKEFGIELAKPNEATFDNRRIKGPRAVMTPEVERRFIITVVVIRTLTGGLDFRVDWVLVSQYFQEYSVNFLAKYWASLQPAKKTVIDRLVTDFQEAFLPAYQSGEVPRLDYDHLVNYDWKTLIDWVTKNVDTTLANKPFNLPGTKQELKQAYDLMELNRDPKRWREGYFGLATPIYKRMEAAAAEPYTVQPQQEPSRDDLDELALARSWVRATALTPQQDFDLNPKLAHEKLLLLGLPLVDQVLKALLSEKVLMKRAKSRTLIGRKYEATDNFFAPLRKHIREETFVQAVKFKRSLDEQFRGGVECVRSDYMANEGAIMVTTTLQAQGRIRLQAVGVPMEKFGLTGGGYETKKIPKEKLRFDMDIYPTESYVFDSENEVLLEFFERNPPHGPETGEIPVWYSISDRIIPDIWKKVLVAVSQIVALRSGINIAGLKRIFEPTMDEWELRILIEWGVEAGLFKPLHENIEGWTVGEEWWLLVGRTCVDGE